MTKRSLRVLSDEDMQNIHQASLRMLENTGMLIDHHEARKMLQEAGAKVDHERKIVKLPPELVEKSLKRMPTVVTYPGRSPENDMVLKAGGSIHTRPNGAIMLYIDLKTGEYKRATTDNTREWSILIDALPNIDGCAPLRPEDTPAQTADIHGLRIVLENQRKHITTDALGVKNLRYMIEMMLAVTGSREELKRRPLVNNVISVISPLFLNEDDAAMLLLGGEYGIPTAMPTMPNAGVSAPLPLAGALALGNAEVLGGFTLAQVAHPGAPATYFIEPTFTDMRTGMALLGSPENALQMAALSQLGSEFYGLPVETSGFYIDGTICEQTLFQKSSNGLTASLAGANLLTGAGTTDFTLAGGAVQLIIDDEIMAINRRICRGFEVNDDTLGLDAIARVGPQGTFLMDEHTLKHLRTHDFRPIIFDRDSRETWLSKGAKGLEQKAREKALSILEEHEVQPLPDDVVKELRAIAKKADQELAK